MVVKVVGWLLGGGCISGFWTRSKCNIRIVQQGAGDKNLRDATVRDEADAHAHKMGRNQNREADETDSA